MKHPYRLKYFFQAILTGAIVAFVSTTSFAGMPKSSSQSPATVHRHFTGKSQPLLNTSAIRGRTLSVSSNGQSRRSVLSPASMLDTTFNHTGTVTTALCTGGNNEANSVAIQSDGKIVVAGRYLESDGMTSQFALARYDTDGTLDNTFGASGIDTTAISTGGEAYSVAIQQDGKIVAAGIANVVSGAAFALVRYDADGTLDNTFGTSGVDTTIVGTGIDDEAYSVAIQSNGKIVAAGFSTSASFKRPFALVRYKADGSLDTTFNHSGMVTTLIGTQAMVSSVAIQSDGKIVVAGYSYDGSRNLFALARYDTDGTLDNTFGTGGIDTTVIGTGGDDEALSVAIQSDGKIVAAGTSMDGSGDNLFALARYNADGTLDNTFGTNGIDTTNFSPAGEYRIRSVAIQSDGKIVAAGGCEEENGNRSFDLARYNTDGSLDNTFGTGGTVITVITAGGDDEPFGVAIQSDGRIVAAGYSWNGSYDVFALARYLGPSDISLAVQATDFIANSDAGSVTLSWKTQSEVNNAGFNVLREETSDLGKVTSAYQVIASYKNDKSLDGLGTSSTGQAYEFTDNKVQSGATYNYEIQSVSTDGTTKDVATLSVTVGVPKTYALYQNYPNPFNPSTTIRFDLKQASNVTLAIYNTLGQRVEYWNYGMMESGRYNKAVNMASFASGVYFYRVVAQGQNGERFVSMKKLMLLK